MADEQLVDVIREELEKLGEVRRESKGWRARCPNSGHDDQKPSFFLYPGGGGRCFSQCKRRWTAEELADLLGLEPTRTKKHRETIVAEYDYRDAEGQRRFQVVRYEPKGFKQRRPNSQGGWIWNLKGVQRLLYRLPELIASSTGQTVFVPEGEKDVDALTHLGCVATCNPGGAGKFTAALRAPLKDRPVVVISDKDDTGRSHAQQVASLLFGFAASVKIIEVPGDGIKDAADWVSAGGNAAELVELADSAPELGSSQAHPSTTTDGNSLPEIMVTDRHLRDIAADAWGVLSAANDPPFVFQRGHLMTDIMADDHGFPVLRTVDRFAFKGFLDRIADFVKLTDEGEKPARPPADVVADMMVAKDLPLPLLHGIIQTPIFDADALLATGVGYQPGTGYFLNLAQGVEIPAVPSQPDQAHIRQAKALLLEELLGDFCFVEDADLAHAVVILLLPFLRLLIQGPTPLHLVESPTPGTGKGLLVDAVSIPAAGRGPSVMTEGRDEDEWRKRITARLLQAPQYILIDNVRSRLDSAALSAALTSETWEDRILGHSRTAALPVTCIWLATANNPGLTLELARRTVSVRLDSRVEQPWQRSGFKHSNLRLWARERRGDLIWSALTLIQSWIAAGKPLGQATLGSYESYAEVIGGVLDVADIPGFLGNANRVYQEADQEVLAWGEFCAAWWETFQDKLVATDQIFYLATSQKLLLDLWSGRANSGARIRFGRALSRMRDRVIGGFCIRHAGQDAHQKVQSYRLEGVHQESSDVFGTDSAGNAGNCGEFSAPAKLIPKQLIADSRGEADRSTAIVPNEILSSEILPAIPRITRNDPWDSFIEEAEE